MAAIELSWDAIKAHKEIMRAAVETILREGIASGEFEPVEPQETARLILCSVVAFTHPMMVAECLDEGEDLEAGARTAIRFVLRAITPR
jgi:hypothetical protein